MLNKRGQGLSVHTIILAVIGLIILVVIVLMLTGKLGMVGKGLDKPATCEDSCNAIGMKASIMFESSCKSNEEPHNYKFIPGDFSDVTGNNVCCCRPK